jgi:hypothetical protein
MTALAAFSLKLPFSTGKPRSDTGFGNAHLPDRRAGA